MTKKDYEKIAKALYDSRRCRTEEEHDCPENDQWCDIVDMISAMLADDSGYDFKGNRLFNSVKFINACQYAR